MLRHAAVGDGTADNLLLVVSGILQLHVMVCVGRQSSRSNELVNRLRFMEGCHRLHARYCCSVVSHKSCSSSYSGLNGNAG